MQAQILVGEVWCCALPGAAGPARHASRKARQAGTHRELAGEESWNCSGTKVAICNFCDAEFQKASRQPVRERVAAGG